MKHSTVVLPITESHHAGDAVAIFDGGCRARGVQTNSQTKFFSSFIEGGLDLFEMIDVLANFPVDVFERLLFFGEGKHLSKPKGHPARFSSRTLIYKNSKTQY